MDNKTQEELIESLILTRKDLVLINHNQEENAHDITITEEEITMLEKDLERLGFIKNILLNYKTKIKSAKQKSLLSGSILSTVIFLIVLFYILSFYDFDKIYILAEKEAVLLYSLSDAIISTFFSAIFEINKYLRYTSEDHFVKNNFSLEGVEAEIKTKSLAHDEALKKLAVMYTTKEQLAKKSSEIESLIKTLENQIAFNYEAARKEISSSSLVANLLSETFNQSSEGITLKRINKETSKEY